MNIPLTGTGEMASRIRGFDWAATPFGPFEQWPISLRSSTWVVLENRFPMALWWGEDLRHLYNDAYVPVLAGKHPDALGRPAVEVWAEIWQILGPQARQVMAGGGATWNEHLLLPMQRRGFVEETYFTFSYSPVRNDEGHIGGVLITCQETTRQVQDERQLRMLGELAMEAAGERSVDEICRRSVAVLESNPADVPFALLYLLDDAGTSARRVATAGLPGYEGPAAPATVPMRADRGAWPLAQARDQGAPLVVESLADFGSLPPGYWNRAPESGVIVPLIPAAGTAPYGFLVAGVSPLRALDDGYLQLFRLAGDQITAAIGGVHAFQAERRRAEELAALDQAKTAFFSNVSHEFRTPLTLMLGPTEDALASAPRALSGENLDAVYRNQLRLLKLVNTLLDFARIEAGRMQAAYEPTDLTQLTADLASTFRSAVERAGLHYVVDCGPLDEPAWVDRGLWEKIVLNLLSNALKFTLAGEVAVTLRQKDDSIVLTVRDTGVGIGEADLSRVFQRFQRIDGAPARTLEGSGIGLALVSDLVQLHGGTCAVDSVLGQGTTFTITLPAGKAHLPADRVIRPGVASPARGANPFVVEALRWLPEPATANPAGPAAQAGSPETQAPDGPAHILVADDNADMREYLVRLLGTRWAVAAVANGRDALEMARRRPPDLLLTDVMMPGLDGFQLLQALRADERTAAIPVIMLSARAGEEARVEGVQAGADDYLVKPFSARELMARVGAHLRLARTTRERAQLLAREQQALREAQLQKQHLHDLFMQTPAAIAILRGPEYIIELANAYTCRLWGRQHRDVINRPLFEVLPEIRDQVWKYRLDQVYRSGEPFVGSETPARLDTRGDGNLEAVYLNFVYSPLRNALDQVDGILVIAIDVTDQVTLRRELGHLREAAESASRIKDEFLAVLGHELRNPLAPIRTALQLLKLRRIDSIGQETAIIDRQVAHLVRLVDDLLDVSRITQGKIELHNERLEVAEVLTRAVEMVSPLLEQRRHTLTVNVPRSGLCVHGDRARLAQVFSNLLTNAARYTGPHGEITLTACAEAEEVVVRVRDNGAGLLPEMVARIFDTFVQERQPQERPEGGLGLGLAIVRSLVGLHGGRVSAASEGKGQGAEFTVRLPRVIVPAAEATGTAPSHWQMMGQDARGRVLVVDDNEDGALMLSQLLAVVGYTTRHAPDGPSALEVAETFDPDIALLDIGLPVMDGYELARRFAAHPRLSRTQLVAVTGYGQEQDRQQAAAAGFRAHLVKPVDLDELCSTLEQIGPRRAQADPGSSRLDKDDGTDVQQPAENVKWPSAGGPSLSA